MAERADPPTEAHGVPFREAARFWVKLGFINFGGPTGQIAIMHEEIVERRRWISNGRFLHALNYCMLLPGPEAQQLAIYVGWLLHKVRGGLVAGIAFVLPSFFVMLVPLVAVRRARGRDVGERDALGSGRRRDRDRGVRDHPDREEGAGERPDGGDRRRRVRLDLPAARAVPA